MKKLTHKFFGALLCGVVFTLPRWLALVTCLAVVTPALSQERSGGVSFDALVARSYNGAFTGNGAGLTNVGAGAAGIALLNGKGTNTTIYLNATNREPYWELEQVLVTNSTVTLWNSRGNPIISDDAKNGGPNQRILYSGGTWYDAYSYAVAPNPGARIIFGATESTNDFTQINTGNSFRIFPVEQCLTFGYDVDQENVIAVNGAAGAYTELQIGKSTGSRVRIAADNLFLGTPGDSFDFHFADAVVTVTNDGVRMLTLDVETELTGFAGMALHFGDFTGSGLGLTNFYRTNAIGGMIFSTPTVTTVFTNTTSQAAFVNYSVRIDGDPELEPSVQLLLKVTNGGTTYNAARCGQQNAKAAIYFTMSALVAPGERSWIEEDGATSSFTPLQLVVTRF